MVPVALFDDGMTTGIERGRIHRRQAPKVSETSTLNSLARGRKSGFSLDIIFFENWVTVHLASHWPAAQ